MVIMICILACFIGGWVGKFGAEVFIEWYRPRKMKRMMKKEFKKFCKAVGIDWKKVTPEELMKKLNGGKTNGTENRESKEHL